MFSWTWSFSPSSQENEALFDGSAGSNISRFDPPHDIFGSRASQKLGKPTPSKSRKHILVLFFSGGVALFQRGSGFLHIHLQTTQTSPACAETHCRQKCLISPKRTKIGTRQAHTMSMAPAPKQNVMLPPLPKTRTRLAAKKSTDSSVA